MLDQIRRIVTGNDESGSSIVHFDSVLPRRLGSNRRGLTELWNTDGTPIESQIAEERTELPFSLTPPSHGTRLLFFTVAPEDPNADRAAEEKRAAEAFAAYNAGHTRPSTQRHPWMHKTETIDYVIVLKGELSIVLDGDERHLKPFDVVIQRGTNHAWVNRGTESVLLAAVLVDATVR